MTIGLLTWWFSQVIAHNARSNLGTTSAVEVTSHPLSQTSAAMAHICAMTAGDGPFGIQLSRAIRLFVEPILSLTLLALVVPCFNRYRNQTLQ